MALPTATTQIPPLKEWVFYSTPSAADDRWLRSLFVDPAKGWHHRPFCWFPPRRPAISEDMRQMVEDIDRTELLLKSPHRSVWDEVKNPIFIGVDWGTSDVEAGAR